MNLKDKFHEPGRYHLLTFCRTVILGEHSPFGQVYLLGPQGIHLFEGEWQNIFLSVFDFFMLFYN